ncbi:hypothetical protein MNB_SV-14-1828 [hydrothermal vent metagenome]|uniref:Uncharacterized protein n=1 Tax=hydrothermal vent metagenome TaxID=652676 RepID=A0A1W1BZB1_9ZZZZ
MKRFKKIVIGNIVGTVALSALLFGADIAGDYLSVSKDGQGYRMPISFKKNGKVTLMGMDAGTWKESSDGKTVSISSVFDNGKSKTYTIKSQSSDMLVLKIDENEIKYHKIDKTKLLENNKQAPVIGDWTIKTANVTETFSFSLPDNLKYVKEDKSQGTTDTAEGNWYYDKQKKQLLIAIMKGGMTGESNIKTVSANKMTLLYQGKSINLVKK